ncbi:MAG: hypothetical protein KC912_18925 [Proteobacteria bacterium]|nr:hypothetical protein [Pseudomonadota bacterium]
MTLAFSRPLGLLFFLAACSSAEPVTATDTDSSASVDTGETQTGDTDTGSSADSGSSSTASLSGTIDRSAEPSNGGVGHLYVVVMEENPMTGGGDALGAVIIENADFTSSGASYDYTISGIEPGTAEVFVTAFLDDNANADATEPGPDMGDLVSMEGVSFPSIVIDQATAYDLDLTLSFSMPF